VANSGTTANDGTMASQRMANEVRPPMEGGGGMQPKAIIYIADSRNMAEVADEGVHLIRTLPLSAFEGRWR